jgi:hypothetical protein
LLTFFVDGHVAKKTIDDESESRKKTTMVSKSGTTHGFFDRRWNGGSCRCQQCINNNNYSTHNHGWTGVGERQTYVAWSGVGMWPGVGAGTNKQQGNTRRFGVGMTFLAFMDYV